MKPRTTIYATLISCLVISAIIAYYTLWQGCLVVSNGQIIGELQKVSHKGIFIKTFEGELAKSGSGGSQKGKAGQGTTDFSNTWSFSVTDEEVAEKIAEHVKHGNTHVRMEYEEYYFKGRYDSNYRAIDVEVIK